jgi:hypothetical protein
MPTTEVALHRSVRKEDLANGVIIDGHAVTGVLYPAFEPKRIETKQGDKVVTRVRAADIIPYTHEGQSVVDPGGGTSLFDREYVFGTKYWWDFKLPTGTVIPESLRLRHTGHNKQYRAEHYQIEPAANRMTVTAYKGALDNLARNAVEKLYRDARTGTSTRGT